MRVIIAGGGTGGHLYPAIAVAEEIIKGDVSQKTKKSDILFVGTEQGIEKRVVPLEGYRIEFLRVEGFVGRSFRKKLKSLFLFVLSFKTAFQIIDRFRPKVVIGAGGYASLSIALMAKVLDIPVVVLEQNSIPGLANRIIGRFADAICVTYEESVSKFPKAKIYHTGNPVRDSIFKGDVQRARETFHVDPLKKTVFVFGGSLGAHAINRAIIDALPYMLDLRLYIQFIHQTGQNDFEDVKTAYQKAGFKSAVHQYIYQMADVYAISDLIICRAGATTLSEITALGKCAVLIPFPYAAANHQVKNAQRLESMNACKVILENHLTPESLARLIRQLIQDDDMRKEIARNASVLGKPDAAKKVSDIVFSLARR
ncbi:MAG: undecaprenyldiphospho-muramoylpentapeptide beta-N-acetylglucosaminyltransferase [Thermodesulfovibrionales bacterium]|nr:undecaprenyldiphospho-muramoylpentapeptide beta-N-acetylglucosaminyltransferase [Thermodesulfovibrionales bacterium]